MTRMVFGFIVLATACAGQSPVSPSSTGSSTTDVQQADSVNLSVLGVARRGDQMRLTVRNGGNDVRVGLAVYKRIQTTSALVPSNLALYSDGNVLVGAGETREITAEAVPCGPFQFVVYHTRLSAGNPALSGAPSGYDLTVEHVLTIGQDEWNRWSDCVAR